MDRSERLALVHRLERVRERAARAWTWAEQLGRRVAIAQRSGASTSEVAKVADEAAAAYEQAEAASRAAAEAMRALARALPEGMTVDEWLTE
jgi:hypothetical protein